MRIREKKIGTLSTEIGPAAIKIVKGGVRLRIGNVLSLPVQSFK